MKYFVTGRQVKIPACAAGLRIPRQVVPIQLSDLQEGDRVLVRAKPGDDGTSLVASTVIAMKKADISAKQTHEREDRQRRGIGGLVRAWIRRRVSSRLEQQPRLGRNMWKFTFRMPRSRVDTRRTLRNLTMPSRVRRQEIRPGDELRARVHKSEDGSNFTAEEIVTGAFRNIAGTVEAVDAGADTLTGGRPGEK